jgi:hypothetical protein
MKYFRLIDDINFPQRWYLGDILETDDNWQFINGHKINDKLLPEKLSVLVYLDGKPMDFTTNEAYCVPIVSSRFKKQLEGIDGLQFLPVTVKGNLYELSYFIMVVTNKKNYINEELSEFSKFVENDPIRPDKAGHYSWFSKLVIDPSKLKGEDVFRVDKGELYLVVSQKIKEAIEEINATGTVFIEV